MGAAPEVEMVFCNLSRSTSQRRSLPGQGDPMAREVEVEAKKRSAFWSLNRSSQNLRALVVWRREERTLPSPGLRWPLGHRPSEPRHVHVREAKRGKAADDADESLPWSLDETNQPPARNPAFPVGIVLLTYPSRGHPDGSRRAPSPRTASNEGSTRRRPRRELLLPVNFHYALPRFPD
eukprot:scaffold803_cov310-Pinguiococcus_pyrenoidosus.AAC.166